MYNLYILILHLLPLLFDLVSSIEEQVQCNWDKQYICGDKCTDIGKICLCGEIPLPFQFAPSFICCNKIPCLEIQGNVFCAAGQVQSWSEICHGKISGCNQVAQSGYNTLPCDDDKNCYISIWACRGKAQCSE